jgi:hypothetical protein
MRGVVLAACAAEAACFQPLYRDGLPCAPAGSEPRCPTGQICVDGVCHADDISTDAAFDATLADSDGDLDDDGVVDAIDNCVGRPNPTQHDEDADDLGDPCDPCPHFDMAQGDTDGDGVGDDCDPSPQQDSILYFSGFEAPDPAWTFTGGGSWQFVGGGLEQSALIPSSTEAIPPFDPTQLDVLRVDVYGTITGITSGFRTLYLRFGKTGSVTDPYHLCAIDNAEAATMSSKVLEYFDGANYVPISPAIPGTASGQGQPFFIAFGAYFSDLYASCYVELATDPAAELGDDATNLSRGGTSLHTKSLSARFEYYIAIGH